MRLSKDKLLEMRSQSEEAGHHESDVTMGARLLLDLLDDYDTLNRGAAAWEPTCGGERVGA